MSPFAILDAVRRHRSLAQTKIKTLQLELAALEKEAEEFAIAERVVTRLAQEAGESLPQDGADGDDAHHGHEHHADHHNGAEHHPGG
jgi:hypothetical protein